MEISKINSTGSTGSTTKDDIYEVQEIVGMKTEGDITVYRVRWKGYGPQSDTWEPESNLYNVWKMVEKYKTKINKMPLLCNTRRRGRPSNTNSTSSTGSSSSSSSGGGISGSSSCGNISEKNSSTVDSVVVKSSHSMISDIKREKMSFNNKSIKQLNDRKIIHKKNQKKKLKYIYEKSKESKDTFWKDLEEGRIDIFKEDLYSRVKSRASSRGNSRENSPKANSSSPKESDNWADTDTNDYKDINSIETTEELMDGELRVKFCKTEALMAAIKECDQELAKILIENGSDINSTYGNRNGSTPLMICCEDNNVDMTQFLLSNGALKDLQNQNGDTALIIACRLGFKDIIKLLLIFGSNFAIINKIGENALKITRISAKTCIQVLLFEHISKLTISLEVQVMNMLCNTAKIVNALFPIQCYSVSESKNFSLRFEFDSDRHQIKAGIGYILFVANACITESGIRCGFSGPNIVEEVLLNGTAQKPLTEGAQFVFSFVPLSRGTNELVLKTFKSEEEDSRHIKLLVCAYRLQLINDSQCYESQD